MTKHLERDLQSLQNEILSLTAMVEEMIDAAGVALLERRHDLAEKVAHSDHPIDQREVHIEEECLKILALHQPVAIDLRRIATVLKVNNDLERIADLAVNISERALALDKYPQFPIPAKMKQMVSIATQMVRGAMDAFVGLDSAGARRIVSMDDSIDALNVEVIQEIQDLMQRQPNLVPAGLHCFSASRHVERIADHASNIAEDVVYLAEGEIVRHRHRSLVP